MRFLIAMMKHETNTFSPVPTDISRFHINGKLLSGDEAIKIFEGTGTAISGFLDRAREIDIDIEVPLAADAWPSGPVHSAAYETMTQMICDELKNDNFDGVLLDLHGAMVTTDCDDGEGDLLRRLREINPTIPIGVALDMHANVTPQMVEHATIISGYKTYPHIDEYQTGQRAFDLLMHTIQSEKPVSMVWNRAPMLPHVMRQSTLEGPNKVLQEQCADLMNHGALDASLFMGFPHADVPYAGVSAIVIEEEKTDSTQELCDELLEKAWSKRADFVYNLEPLEHSLKRAQNLAATNTSGCPVILLDHYDNAASGGTMDTVKVLEAVLKLDLDNLLFFAICDPQSASQAKEAGIDSKVQLKLGGKIAQNQSSRSLSVEGQIEKIVDGKFVNRGPVEAGVHMDMGPSALVRIGNAQIVICSKQIEPFDVACFEIFDIDPLTKSFVVLKSRIHWRAGLGHIAGSIVECAGEGVCTSNFNEMNFEKIQRPIYPIDLDTIYETGDTA